MLFRSGRPYWWIWVIFVFPALGSVVYAIVEVLPEFRRGPAFAWGSWFKSRQRRIRELRERLAETDTVNTRLELAAELAAARRFEEAYAVLYECLTGVFRDDPHLLLEAARLLLQMDKGPEALDVLNQVRVERDKWLEMKRSLLKGWALQCVGQLAEAETMLRSLAAIFPGDEPRYRLGLVLLARGRKEEAAGLFEDIIQKFRKAGPAWRRAEREWFRLAKARLKELRIRLALQGRTQ